jgi:integrase
MKFTAKNVKTLTPKTGKSEETIWSDDLPGFGVRFREGGAGTFIIQYFLNGKPRKISLGKVMKVPLDAAEKEAKQLFAAIARKEDPHANRAKVVAKASEMFNAKIEAFLTWQGQERPDKPARTEDYIAAIRRSLMRYFKGLHKYSLADITRKIVSDQLDSIEENHGTRACGTSRAHLSSYFTYLMLKGYDGFNPVDGTEARSSESRTRFLDASELALLWKATEGGGDYNTIVRLIVLTAARKTIIGSLERTEYDPENRVIDVAADATGKAKNGTRFWLALSRPAEIMLTNVLDRRENSEFVFGRSGEGGFSGWSSAKEALDDRITELNGGVPIPHWVLHDLRRSFNTLGVDYCGIDPGVADAALYHVGEGKKGIKKTYFHGHLIDKKHDAMQRWADFLDEVIRGKRDFRIVKDESQEVAAQ